MYIDARMPTAAFCSLASDRRLYIENPGEGVFNFTLRTPRTGRQFERARPMWFESGPRLFSPTLSFTIMQRSSPRYFSFLRVFLRPSFTADSNISLFACKLSFTKIFWLFGRSSGAVFLCRLSLILMQPGSGCGLCPAVCGRKKACFRGFCLLGWRGEGGL